MVAPVRRAAHPGCVLVSLLCMMVFAGCFSASRKPPLEGTPFRLERVTTVNVQEVSEEHEQRFGYYMDAMAQQSWPMLEPEHPLTLAVDRIGQRLARVSDRPALQYTFKVINDPGWANALATAGGFVYVTTGLLTILETEDELAAALAHEIGHMAARHGIKKEQTRQQWALMNQILAHVVAAGGAVAAGQATKSATGSELAAAAAARAGAVTAGGLTAVFSAVMLSAYDRDQEREADTLGLRYLEHAGYQLQAALSLLTKLEALEHAAGRGIFATHPSPAERRQTILHYLRGHQ